MLVRTAGTLLADSILAVAVLPDLQQRQDCIHRLAQAGRNLGRPLEPVPAISGPQVEREGPLPVRRAGQPADEEFRQQDTSLGQRHAALEFVQVDDREGLDVGSLQHALAPEVRLDVIPGHGVHGEVVTAHDDREHLVGWFLQRGSRWLRGAPEERGGPVQLPGFRDDGLFDIALEGCHVT